MAKLYLNVSNPPNTPNQAAALTGFTVSPNPAQSSNLITIRYDEDLKGRLQYTIFNTEARVAVKGYSRLEHDKGNIKIDISNLKKGQYFLRLQHCQQQGTLQLIVD